MSDNYSKPIYYARETNLMYRVYAWMCYGLLLTTATAYYVASSPAIMKLIFHDHSFIIPMVLFLIQIGLVIALSAFIQKMTFSSAVILFSLFALSMGVTLSVIFIAFTLQSIFSTFLVASGMFGAMAIYGYVTKADLTSMGSFLFMALIGLIIGGFVNMFLHSEKFNYVLSAIGVLVFTLLTAYDVQKIKRMTQDMLEDKETMAKVTIVGAMTLYLDFVNLFLYLLQFMGRRREN